MFDKLDAYAEGRGYARGAPQLSRCVREAIEHFLVCTHRQQTRNVLPVQESILQKIENVPSTATHTKSQMENVLQPKAPVSPIRQKILTLLGASQEGLTRKELDEQVGKSLKDTLGNMGKEKDGLIAFSKQTKRYTLRGNTSQ